MAIPLPLSVPAPPRYVLYTRADPAAFSLATKAFRTPARVDRMGDETGKLIEPVHPVMYAFCDESSAIENPRSSADPPRYVLYTIAVPAELSLVTNASTLPPDTACS